MIYSKSKNYTLYLGKMEDELSNIDDNSIGSIVTDPPYELGFMGKSWDSSGVAFQKSTWEHCYRVLKPGGYLLAFGGSRTYHRIACAIEDAGFEIRDTVMWLYGSGFPKSMSLGKVIEGKQVLGSANVRDIKKLDGEKEQVSCGFNKTGKETGYRDKEYEMYKTNVNYTTELGKKWQGWGTALKPSFEPIIVARKPFKGSLVDNVIEYGVGGINIDECRVGFENGETNRSIDRYNSTPQKGNNGWEHKNRGAHFNEDTKKSMQLGRFPANTILTYDETDFDEVCGGFPKSKGSISQNVYTKTPKYYGNALLESSTKRFPYQEGYNDNGSASRYFYCAKASKKDRDEGLAYHMGVTYELSDDVPKEIVEEIKRLLNQ